VIGLQKMEAPPISVKQTELKSIFIISTEMGGVSMAVETSFPVFYPTYPDLEVRTDRGRAGTSSDFGDRITPEPVVLFCVPVLLPSLCA